jgi:DnaJ family protein B protein 4
MFGEDIFKSYGEGGGSMHQGVPRKAAPVENKLRCSLEELYKGASKRMKISREIVDPSGSVLLRIAFYVYYLSLGLHLTYGSF